MVTVHNTGAYLLGGNDWIPDGADAAAIVRQKTGSEPDRAAARRATMAYRILQAHNQSGDEKKLRIRFDAMLSHDITYVGIIQQARASGMNVKAMRIVTVLCATGITASCVSMCGQVGWIGLLIPHCARMLVGSNNRYVVPLSLSLGASFMILIDTLSRSISIIELPLSILTAIIGAPAFISLLNKTRSNLQ